MSAGIVRSRRQAHPTVAREAARVRRALVAQARPAGSFDPGRYFRPSVPLAFLNVRTAVVRALGRDVARAHREDWSMTDVVAFADILVRDVHLEVKGAGIACLAARHRDLRPEHLRTVKRWLSGNHAANWATTDVLCASVVDPLLRAHPHLIPLVAAWARDRNPWVRRAAAVGLVKLAARGEALDVAYDVATALREDRHDLVQKAAGWLLREAGRSDPRRLERYLVAGGPAIARTTLRYAIERWPPEARRALLRATRSGGTDSRGTAPAGPRRRPRTSPRVKIR